MEEPQLVPAAKEYVQNTMKHNSFHFSSFYKSGRDLLLAIQGLYQERNTTCSPSFPAFVRTVTPANETTSAPMKQLFSNIMRFHEHDPRKKSEKWRARNERQQQSLMWAAKKFLASTTSPFIVGPVVGQNIIPATRILQRLTNQYSTLADDLEPATERFDVEYIIPIKRLQ